MTTDGRNLGAGGDEHDPRLARLYREAAREQPPAHLDAAILAAAHREAGAHPRPLSARLRVWRVPVSIAAVVVLSVSLVTLVREEGGDQLMQPSERKILSTHEQSAPAELASKPGEATAPQARKAPAAEQLPAPVVREDRAPGASAPEGARRQQETPAPPPAARSAPQPFASAVTPERAPLEDRGAGTGADATSRSSRVMAAEEPSPPVARQAPAPQAEDQAGARDAASGALRAPAAAPAERPRARVEARAAPRKEALAADSTRIAALLKELEAQPPGKWLERIEALRREGRAQEADELLAEFKRRFSDQPLPSGSR